MKKNHPSVLKQKKIKTLKAHQNRARSVRQRGTILISALLITALAAILATDMMSRQSNLLAQAQWTRNAEKTAIVLQEAKHRIMLKIYQAISQSPDHLLHHLPADFNQSLQINHIPVIIRTVDAQTKWNLNSFNNISQTRAQQQEMTTLLQALSGHTGTSSGGQEKLTLDQAQELTTSIWHYISIYIGGSRDNFYLSRQPPAFAAHQMLAHVSQLRSIDGISRLRYQQYHGALTALPTTLNRININDINNDNQAVLSVFNIPPNEINSWKSCLQKNGVIISRENLQAAIKSCPPPNQNLNSFLSQRLPKNHLYSAPAQLVEHSNYIFISIQAKIDQQTAGLQALLFVAISKDQRAVIKELWENSNLDNL